jgi:hypothetical protein
MLKRRKTRQNNANALTNVTSLPENIKQNGDKVARQVIS